MYTIRIEDTFAAAHFLADYHGKCENMHGHNYRVRVWCKGETLGEGGMLADFADLKKCLKTVLEDFDHRNLNDLPVFAQNPSAERIAHTLFNRLEKTLPLKGIAPALLAAVEVFETPLNMARYEPSPA